jgi:seryl-tRNA synthetase
MDEMAGNLGSKDKSLEALDFIINVLKEHEQNLDKSISEFAAVTEHMGNTEVLNGRIEKVEEKIGNLQKEITNLIGILSNSPKETLPIVAKKQELQTEAASSASVAVVQGRSSVTLHCKQWREFQSLALNAQTVSFSFKEAEKVFQAEALKGNQLIFFSGALPNFAIILKTWLSRQLGIAEGNVLEGFLDTPK